MLAMLCLGLESWCLGLGLSLEH